jgi:hypothetical protein
MKLFIPTIGVQLKLVAPAVLKIHFEDRNKKLLSQFGINDVGSWSRSVYKADDKLIKLFGSVQGTDFLTVTLPEGSILSIDRIYIRKSVGDYDSITFNLLARKGKEKKSFPYGRFWVKLDDANSLDVEVVKTVEEVKENREERRNKAIEKEADMVKRSFARCVALSEKLNYFRDKLRLKRWNLSVSQNSSQYNLIQEECNIKEQLRQYLSGNDILKIIKDIDKEFK